MAVIEGREVHLKDGETHRLRDLTNGDIAACVVRAHGNQPVAWVDGRPGNWVLLKPSGDLYRVSPGKRTEIGTYDTFEEYDEFKVSSWGAHGDGFPRHMVEAALRTAIPYEEMQSWWILNYGTGKLRRTAMPTPAVPGKESGSRVWAVLLVLLVLLAVVISVLL